MAHRQRSIQKPDSGAQVPNPVEIAAHLHVGCAARGGRPFSPFLKSVTIPDTIRGSFVPGAGSSRPLPLPRAPCATIPVPVKAGVQKLSNSASQERFFVCRTRILDPRLPARLHRAPVPIPPPLQTPSRRLPEIPASRCSVPTITVGPVFFISTCLFLFLCDRTAASPEAGRTQFALQGEIHENVPWK
jgi:hypothetical protein